MNYEVKGGKPLKVCIVGCGQVCEYHISHYKEKKLNLGHATFVDLDGKKAESMMKYWQGQGRTADMSVSIPSNVDDYDLAIIQTPNGKHRQHAEPFVLAGVPVLVEKPLCVSQEDLEWFHRQEEHGAWIAIAYQCNFYWSIRKIREQVKNAKKVLIDCWKHRCRWPSYYADGWHGTWEFDGGTLNQQTSHCVDLVMSMTDEDPETVIMVGHNNQHDIECEDTCSVLVNFKDWTAIIHGTTAMRPMSGFAGIRVVTDKGSFSAKGFAFNTIEEWQAQTEQPKKHDQKYIMDFMVEAIRKGQPSPLPVHEAARSMKVVHAAYESWLNGSVPVKYGTMCEKLGKPSFKTYDNFAEGCK